MSCWDVQGALSGEGLLTADLRHLSSQLIPSAFHEEETAAVFCIRWRVWLSERGRGFHRPSLSALYEEVTAAMLLQLPICVAGRCAEGVVH